MTDTVLFIVAATFSITAVTTAVALFIAHRWPR